VLTVYHLIL